jgi:hypothetical protein
MAVDTDERGRRRVLAALVKLAQSTTRANIRSNSMRSKQLPLLFDFNDRLCRISHLCAAGINR